MSDPREYNYISCNEGTQANIGSYFTSQQTWKQGDTKETAVAVDLTDIILSGNIKVGAVDIPLVEVFAVGDTGFFVDGDRTLGKWLFQISETDTGQFTTTATGIYDIRGLDANLLLTVINKGKMEFKLTASS